MKFACVLALGSAYLSAVVAAPTSDFDANVAKGLRLVQTSESAPPGWLTEDQTLELLRADRGFFDLTDTYHETQAQKAQGVQPVVEQATYPPPSQGPTVQSIISTLSIPNMKNTLEKLTSYNNRYYKSDTGVSASNWIYSQLKSVAGGKSGITISQFDHSWPQKSIIAKFDGASTSAGAVIFGCHIDSINLADPAKGPAPGADDNGTGTMNLMEVFRALVHAGFSPARPVEFHFYAGEEAGLLGSQDIATRYMSEGRAVYAMINLDMTGYVMPGTKEIFALITDNVDTGLTDYLRSLISTYCAIPADVTKCGYACSDHASWNKNGYPAAFPFEALFEHDNKNIHTPLDTTSVVGFSWSHSLEFAKLVTAVAVELGSVSQGMD